MKFEGNCVGGRLSCTSIDQVKTKVMIYKVMLDLLTKLDITSTSNACKLLRNNFGSTCRFQCFIYVLALLRVYSVTKSHLMNSFFLFFISLN